MIKKEKAHSCQKKEGSAHISALIAKYIKGILILYSMFTVFIGLAGNWQMHIPLHHKEGNVLSWESRLQVLCPDSRSNSISKFLFICTWVVYTLLYVRQPDAKPLKVM
jgi:hypothetical protein